MRKLHAEWIEEINNLDEETMRQVEVEMRESDRALENIEAYRFALRAERQIRTVLTRYLDRPVQDDAPDHDECYGQVWIGACIAGAKICGGHGMGYEDDVLCGHIVNVRRGLAAVDESLEALASLKEDLLVKPAEAKKVQDILTKLRTLVQARIDELRQRVWWDRPG